MAWCLFSTKPSPEPILTFQQLKEIKDSLETLFKYKLVFETTEFTHAKQGFVKLGLQTNTKSNCEFTDTQKTDYVPEFLGGKVHDWWNSQRLELAFSGSTSEWWNSLTKGGQSPVNPSYPEIVPRGGCRKCIIKWNHAKYNIDISTFRES